MSDSCMYEFEDIWDDLCQSDDHIVPLPLDDSRKKNISYISEDRPSAGSVDQGSEERSFTSLNKRKNRMLERDSRSHKPSGVFSSSADSDSIKEASSLASKNTTSSSDVFQDSNTDSHGSELCMDDAIIEVKDSSDFLYYGWPEIENFEDVDRIFRSCDSTFGLGASKEDELGWFSSSDNIGGTEEFVNSDAAFSCPGSNSVESLPANHDFLKSHSSNDTAMMTTPVRLRDSPWISEEPDSYMCFANGPAIVNGEEGVTPKSHMNEHQKQVKLENQSMEKREENNFQNGSIDFTDNSPSSGLTSIIPTSSAVKTETNELTSPSTRDSSNKSNLVSSMDCSHDPPQPVTAPTGIGKREKLHNCYGGQSPIDNSIKPANIVVQATSSDPGSVAKEAQYAGDKSENHSDIEDSCPFIPAELGSSNIQECSTNSGIDDVSLEAASFRQLQLVMKQLDLRTKICIRDSLYRLARSAEQRHAYANLNSSCSDGRDASGALLAEGEKSFMDIETDTNPIDRSVAHLLFHRPSESSPASAQDSLQFKPTTVHK